MSDSLQVPLLLVLSGLYSICTMEVQLYSVSQIWKATVPALADTTFRVNSELQLNWKWPSHFYGGICNASALQTENTLFSLHFVASEKSSILFLIYWDAVRAIPVYIHVCVFCAIVACSLIVSLHLLCLRKVVCYSLSIYTSCFTLM